MPIEHVVHCPLLSIGAMSFPDLRESEEFRLFRSMLLLCNGQLFEPQEVPGDGNCFFHSLALSPNIPYVDAIEARTAFIGRLMDLWGSGFQVELQEQVNRSSQPQHFLEYLLAMGLLVRPPPWVSDVGMTLACAAFKVKIVSISNTMIGFQYLKCWEWLPAQLQVPDDAPIVFNYHHAHRAPLTPTHFGNHYCYLQPMGEPTPSQADAAYDGLLTPVEPFPIDLSSQANSALVSVPGKLVQPSIVDGFTSDKGKKKTAAKKTAAKKSTTKKATTKKETTKKATAKNDPKTSGEKKRKPVPPALLAKFLKMQTVDDATIAEVEEATLSCTDMTTKIACARAVYYVVDTVEKQHSDAHPSKSTAPRRVSMGNDERNWDTRCFIIYAFLHPMIGRKNYQLVCEAFRVNLNTLRGWITKSDMRLRWIPKVEKLRVKDILCNMSPHCRTTFGIGDHAAFQELDMSAMKREYHIPSPNATLTVVDKNWVLQGTKRKSKALEGKVYAAADVKRERVRCQKT
jgi:hypothetical protein